MEESTEMTIDEAEAALAAMLEEDERLHGRSVEGWLRTWQRFAERPVTDAADVEDDGDMILAQWGTEDEDEDGSGPWFELDLTRQFLRPEDEEDDDEDDELIQLHSTWRWAPTPETEALGSGTLWSEDAEDFWAEVRALPGFAWALATEATPRDLVLGIEEC